MLAEALFGFLFTVAWALSYALVIKQKSTVKALLGVFLLFGAMLAVNSLRFRGSLLGWFLGIVPGFFVGLWLVQKYGPEKPTEESAVAVLLFGPLIMVGLLVALLLL
ncbi:conserved membrane protein of unknown function [Thermococcus nautili]|uniref:hypothetical protein n=1 Tax=Thermococcus nautili TaxID=195522 RepID=UPI002557A41D|nr:hypothetical protein [Thermococcus nautili]CAI1493622.1 conserved membrane protein of unknown function [Thermococcus nautili]